MATVSILIPAYKPQYLAKAIGSALHQTFEDVEILVGDDTADGSLADIVRSISDPRVQYFHHGFQKGALNFQALWKRAQGPYIKWLFDDDLLMPTSVETLVAALRDNPDAAMAFHERVLIDENDKVISTPKRLLDSGHTARLDRTFLVQHMVRNLHNFVGELTNVMFRRELFDFEQLFHYRSLRLNFLGDAATYLNATAIGPIVVVGGYLSAFRQHGDQGSSQAGPHYSAGLYEWELLARGEAAAGHLDAAALEDVRYRLMQMYAPWSSALPEIARFAASLDELVARDPRELFDSPGYQHDLAEARRAVTSRIALHRSGSARATRQCAVCEKPVDRWLPHPLAGDANRNFMRQMGAVGSTLQNYLCPHCHSNDRERHLWLYLGRTALLADLPKQRVLHIAPEPGIEPKIRARAPLEYVAGDLMPTRPDHRQINVERMNFPDGHFDLIICNHVLEHVSRPQAALAELSRCLAPGGHLVAQTPYSPILRQTFELNVAPSQQFATLYFGQNDHVRLFGADILEHFRAAGLDGDLYPHTTLLSDIDPDVWGCNGREPLFLFGKGKAPALAS